MLKLKHVTQTLRAIRAPMDAAKVLGVEEDSPLLSLTRRSYGWVGDEEVLSDFLVAMYHPDRFQYRMDLTLNA